jgi:peptide/nickel transport system substrate-binding protein
MMNGSGVFVAAATFALASLGVHDNWAMAQIRGGDAVVAQPSAPPTLDPHVTSAQTTLNIAHLIYEQLFTRDKDNKPIGDLASGYEVSEDGKVYTINLRQGVKFHDGSDFTSADAKASLERYKQVGGDKAVLEPIESIEAVDDHTLRLTMSKAVPPFIEQISFTGSMLAIMPESEAAKEAQNVEPIGTGPFMYQEFAPDDYVLLKRFEDYAVNSNFTEPTGFGGQKIAYFDTVRIRFIPEAGGRTAALEAGEVHVVDQVDAPAAERLRDSETVEVYELTPLFMLTLWLNANAEPTSDLEVRKAIQYALDMEEIMAIATNGNYQLDGAWQFPGTTYYDADAGKGVYNAHDLEQVKAIIEASDYNNQPISVLADTNYFFHENGAVVLVEQLKAAGLNAQLNLVDWPTALSVRLKKEGWNAWIVAMGVEPVSGPYSIASLFVGDDPWMRKADPAMDEIYGRLLSATTVEERQEIVRELEAYLYEKFYVLKLGNIGVYQAARAEVANFVPFRFPRMWNIWFE